MGHAEFPWLVAMSSPVQVSWETYLRLLEGQRLQRERDEAAKCDNTSVD